MPIGRSRVFALIEGQGVSIGMPPDGLQKMEADNIEVVDSPDLPPLWQVFGGHRRPDGRWGLPELSAEVASPDAALHIGPQFVILETAAVAAAEAAARRAGRLVACDVPRPRQSRAVPGGGGIAGRADGLSRRGSCSTTRATRTGWSRSVPTCSAAAVS